MAKKTISIIRDVLIPLHKELLRYIKPPEPLTDYWSWEFDSFLRKLPMDFEEIRLFLEPLGFSESGRVLHESITKIRQDMGIYEAMSLSAGIKNLKALAAIPDDKNAGGKFELINTYEVNIDYAYLVSERLVKLIRALDGIKEKEPDKQEGFQPNEDYTQVNYKGKVFRFTKSQALCVQYLHENGSAHRITISELVGSNADKFRIRDLFRKSDKKVHPAWDVLIICDKQRKGFYTLNL